MKQLSSASLDSKRNIQVAYLRVHSAASRSCFSRSFRYCLAIEFTRGSSAID